MLTMQQTMILTTAAQTPLTAEQKLAGITKSKIVDEAIKRVKALDPKMFIRDPQDPNGASADMKDRIFFDEPESIKPEHYKTHIVPRTKESRTAMYERRSKRMLMK